MESQTEKLAPNNASTNLIIGSRSGGREHWDGFLDDIAIWDSVISAGDITALAGGTAADTLGAGAYWNFEDDQTQSTAANAGGSLSGSDLTGITPIPEPSSLALVLIGAAGIMRRRRS